MIIERDKQSGLVDVWQGADTEQAYLAWSQGGYDDDEERPEKPLPTFSMTREEQYQMVTELLRGPEGAVGPMGPMGVRG